LVTCVWESAGPCHSTVDTNYHIQCVHSAQRFCELPATNSGFLQMPTTATPMFACPLRPLRPLRPPARGTLLQEQYKARISVLPARVVRSLAWAGPAQSRSRHSGSWLSAAITQQALTGQETLTTSTFAFKSRKHGQRLSRELFWGQASLLQHRIHIPLRFQNTLAYTEGFSPLH
jgi:hypothetical protein